MWNCRHSVAENAIVAALLDPRRSAPKCALALVVYDLRNTYLAKGLPLATFKAQTDLAVDKTRAYNVRR
jgi:hypothetical protein